jgi:hypothetical protein
MYKYSCIKCNYNTNNIYNYNLHCDTIKHKKNINHVEPIIFVCEYCSKEYKVKNSIRYHKSKCKLLYDELVERKKLEKYRDDSIKEINEIKQEIKQELNELKDTIIPLEEKVNTLDHKIDNVKPVVFNLNVFLNEDCKNAISFDELLEKLQYHFDSSRSLTEDTSITILKTLSTMTLYERPIHCVDLKRNKLMIKDNDKWTKDLTVFNKLPKHATKNYSKHVNKWTEKNPDFLDNEDKAYVYNLYANKEGQEINTPKIIRNVSKVTTIPKKEIKNDEQ